MSFSSTILLLLFCAFATPAYAATVVVATTDDTGINAAITTAAEGDTVYMPAGTYSIDATITVSKGIWLVGAGIDVTILEETGIVSGAMIAITTVNPVRITGFTIREGVGAARTGQFILVGSTTVHVTHVRLDHLDFEGPWTQGASEAIATRGFGVADNLTFSGFTGSHWAFEHTLTNWGGRNNAEIVHLWPTWFGTSQFWFNEDITVSAGGINNTPAFLDAEGGARWVTRWSTSNMRLASHEGSSYSPGALVIEAYNNDVDKLASGGGCFNFRAGTGLVTANDCTNADTTVATQNQRREGSRRGSVLGGNAVGLYDENDSTVYDTGTSTAGSGQDTLEDTSKNWSPSQWTTRPSDGVGYLVIDCGLDGICDSDDQTSAEGHWGHIVSHTTDTLTTTNGDQTLFSSGRVYQIRRVTRTFEDPGLGPSKVDYDDGVPVGPPNKDIEPIRAWSNTGVATAFNTASSTPTTNYTTDAHPTWTRFPYRCPNGVLYGAGGDNCATTGVNGACTYKNGCGHPLRWYTSLLNVRSRTQVIAPGATGTAVATAPAVTTRPNSE